MDGRNTIVIERNAYTNEVKYLWKGDVTNILSDLSDNDNSPFSNTKPDYKKFSTGLLTDIAREVVRTIDEAYNKWGMGLHIEINGTQEDYLAIKNAIEDFFPDRHMDCTWNEHIQLPAQIMPKIKSIYHNLNKTLSEYGQIIELSDRNDEKKWLRFGFNWENIVSEKELYSLCAGAGVYLEKVTTQIRAEADRSKEEIFRLEEKLEQSQVQEPEESPEPEAEFDIDKLSKIMKKICKKYTSKIGKEFESLLKDSIEEKYLKEDRIEGFVRCAEIEWKIYHDKEEQHEQGPEMDKRRKYILERLVYFLNRDIRQYTAEIKSEGIHFGDKCIEELKSKFLKEIYASKEFTDEQKEMVRQQVYSGRSVEVPYDTLKGEEPIEEDQFCWTKKTFEKKDVCREYERKLKKALKNKRNVVLDRNSKVFEKWGDAFFEMWKSQDSNAQSDSLQDVEKIREKLKEYQEKSRKLANLQNIFQEGMEKIEAMLSFRKG